MRLVDAPPNLLDTTTFPEIAAALGAKYGYETNVIAGEALREGGYGGIYSVGKAAEFPPALVTLTYKPANAGKKVALVGKGIIYDTGGLSIKVGGIMCGMKHDMGGAAGLFGAFITAVQLKLPIELNCVLCCADNAISARAVRNDDILVMKSGVTVEVNNTDAEGRLVLGDGVYHACTELGPAPDVLIDMATLTGAQGITTGLKHGAVFTDSQEWEDKMCAAGKKSGDLAFPMLYCPEFLTPEFKSNVADHRNLMGCVTNAGSACAAQWVALNLPKEYKGVHVHVDMAYPAFNKDGATGYGVALVAQALGAFQ
jgi:probable aminopeptidase NPEPL1